MGKIPLLLKGRLKVQTEIDIYATAYNFRRLINLESVTVMLAKLQNYRFAWFQLSIQTFLDYNKVDFSQNLRTRTFSRTNFLSIYYTKCQRSFWDMFLHSLLRGGRGCVISPPYNHHNQSHLTITGSFAVCFSWRCTSCFSLLASATFLLDRKL